MDAENRVERVRAAIDQLGPADHACSLYHRRDEAAALAASYVRAGLDRGELCLCVVDDGEKRILDALSAEGVDTDAEIKSGRLVMFEPRVEGVGPRALLERIEKVAGTARTAGYAGSRIVGEMSWALNGDLKELAEFEARVNLTRILERHVSTGLCQFDVRKFTPESLRELIMMHPLVVVGDRVCHNPYYVPPEKYLSADWPRHETDWMMTNLEQLQQSEDDLRESQERYRSLSHRLLEQQERERAALARELHDQLGQSLVALSLNFQLIQEELPPTLNASVPESMRTIEKMIDQVRTLAFELRPSMLDEFGLAGALRLLLARHGQRTGVQASFTASPTDLRAPVDIETACFRIVQEALNNITRHAKATRVDVTLAAGDAVIEVSIKDDGVGFTIEEPRTGVGLIGMGERAELAGGHLDIESTPGDGTTLRARFPLPAPRFVAETK
jgi:signal transduction histidine kinase